MTHPRDVDVVILTALNLEYSAVRSYLTEIRRHIDAHGTRYEIGRSSGDVCQVALAQIGEGNATAAALTGGAIAAFTPGVLLFVGVAGSIAHDVTLGDVVVATRINAFHSGREDLGGFRPRLRGWLLSHGLEQLAREVAQTNWWPGQPADALPPPTVHFKPLVSGDVVLDSRTSPLAKMLAEHYSDAVAIDMESAGFAEAAHRSDFTQAVAIRGISDLTDGGKRGTDRTGWQPRAAANAAAYAITLAERIASRPLRVRPGRRPGFGAARPCPYRGLAAFRERDADLFFGRAELAGELADLAARRRFVTLVGRSGSGKSSMVHAGLIPHMRGRDWAIAAFRPPPDVPAATVLAGGLLPLLRPGLDRVEAISRRRVLVDAIAAGRLPELVTEVLAQTGKSRLLVCVDQFEEFVARDEQAARDLADLLVQLSAGAATAHVVLTVRMETLGIAVSRLGLGEVTRNSVFLLSPMRSGQLRAAIEAPVESTGLVFEPGLVERILESAKDDPESLALMQFALTRLWERQDNGLLTHAAYDGFGGVGGALAAYAEQVWGEDLDEDERIQARRLLVQLVRPAEGDVIRRTARGLELKPELVPIARRLAATRLVVTGTDADGETTFDLAHAALAVHWRRLRNWLDQERDFRTWQEDLRESIRRAEPLRGPRMVNALKWQRDHPDDITRPEREFINTSRRGHRRRTSAWRAGLAAIVALLLLASTFAISLRQRTDELQRQVRINAVRALLTQARERGLDPDTAALLTVAAYRIGQDPAVLAGLAGEYLRYRSANRQFNPGVGGISQLQMSAGGHTIAALGEGGDVAVWRPDQRPVEVHRYAKDFDVTALSPDGRLLAGSTNTGRIEVRRPDGGFTVLRPGGQDSNGARILRFDARGRRLLTVMTNGGLQIWNVKQRRRSSVPPRLARLVQDNLRSFGELREEVSVWFGPDDERVVVATETELALWNLATGRPTRLARLQAGAHATVTRDGRTALTCRSDGSLVLWDLARSRTRLRYPRPSDGCRRLSRTPVDHSGGVILTGVRQEGGEDHPRGVATMLDPYKRVTAHPVVPTSSASSVGDVIATTDQGIRLATPVGPVAVVADVPRAGFAPINSLLRTGFQRLLFSQDGRLALSVSATGGLRLRYEFRLWDAKTGRELKRATDHALNQPLRFSTDGRTVLGVDSAFRNLVALAVPSLRVVARMRLTSAPGVPRPAPLPVAPFSGLCLEQASASDPALLYLSGVISRFDVRSRRPAGAPLPLARDRKDLNRLRYTLACALRPHHDQIAVNAGQSVHAGHTVEVWDIGRGRLMTTLPVHSSGVVLSLRFSADGRLLALLSDDGSVEVWDMDRRRPVGNRLKVLDPGLYAEIVQFPAGDRIVVQDMTTLRVWDLKRRATITNIDFGHGRSRLVVADSVISAAEQTFLAWGQGGLTRISLDPRLWADHLCRVVGRDLTAAERRTLPPGSPTGRICP